MELKLDVLIPIFIFEIMRYRIEIITPQVNFIELKNNLNKLFLIPKLYSKNYHFKTYILHDSLFFFHLFVSKNILLKKY